MAFALSSNLAQSKDYSAKLLAAALDLFLRTNRAISSLADHLQMTGTLAEQFLRLVRESRAVFLLDLGGTGRVLGFEDSRSLLRLGGVRFARLGGRGLHLDAALSHVGQS